MTKEKPIGLVVGLLFIIGFGLILSLVMKPGGNLPPAPAAAEERAGAYSVAPAIYEDSRRFTPVYDTAPPPQADAGAAVDVAVVRPPVGEEAGTVTAEVRGLDSVATLAATETAGRAPAGYRPAGGADSSSSLGGGFTMLAGGRTRYVGPDGVTREHVIGPGPGPARGAAKFHTVEQGDNLIRIARKFYGPENERKYKLIYEANRETMRNESDLQIGQELMIPPLPTAEAAPVAAADPRGRVGGAPPAPAGADRGGRPYVMVGLDDLSGALAGMGGGRVAPAPAPAPAAARTYTIQRGDSLTGIARRTMNDGSAAAVRRLYEANRDVLASPNVLRVGATIRIPG